MPATLMFGAEIIYKKPGTGYWDNEDGVLIFAENTQATVAETAHRSVAVEANCRALELKSFQMSLVWFEGTQDIAVRSGYGEDWR
jgi:hypothetical protein